MPSKRLSQGAVERELLKYLPSLLFRPYDRKDVPASSQDFVLTALAQLGALRLNASRCFISLFDQSRQYILAEATTSLSLQNDLVHNTGDELWFGSTVLQRHAGPCSVVVERRAKAYHDGASEASAVTVVPDLSAQHVFRATEFTSKTPTPRFYACVPLQSPRGAIIGTYGVFHDKPRDALEPAHVQFLKDMATTVMTHLVLSKLREEYRQGERMIRGIGSFVEGKATLRNWRATTGHDEISAEPSRRHYGGEGQLDKRQQLLQNQRHGPHAYFTDIRLDARDERIGDEREPAEASLSLDQSVSATLDSHSTSYDASLPLPLSVDDDEDVAVSPAIPLTFSRAANIIRECLEVEGAVFYHAGTSAYDEVMHNSPESSCGVEATSLDEASRSTANESDTAREIRKSKGKCSVIAYSESHTSSINNEAPSKALSGFPDKFLKSLFRRFPKGKIFHFDANGSLSSGSSGDESATDLLDGPRKSDLAVKQRKRRKARLQDGPMLLKYFPDSRSVGFFPMFDSHHEKWHAGGFIWTKQPNRSFTIEGQLSFLNAIGSTIMAEVSRLNALASDRAKTDLLGSISHELRSPLHGILGSVELLEGSPQTEFQSDCFHSIQVCGRTLLDTIEQLLDFSKINHFSQQKKRMMYRNPGSAPTSSARPGDPATRLDIITEEVVTAVTAGFDAQRGLKVQMAGEDEVVRGHHNDSLFASGTNDEPLQPHTHLEEVVVTLDIDKSMDMAFYTLPGAWRRIVMNLFANSMTYTKTGHIKVSLSATPVHRKQNGSLYKIRLTVVDSGQGISADYLRDGLFKPFSQEDSLESGNGLGLSIVKQIVDSHNGRINVRSVQGVGTKISVSICMERDNSVSQVTQDDPTSFRTNGIAQRIRGKPACLLSYLDATDSTDGPNYGDEVAITLKRTCQDWFGLKLCNESELEAQTCSVFFAIEPELSQAVLDFGRLGRLSSRSKASGDYVLFVICRSLIARERIMAASRQALPDSWTVQCIIQPCGPHKLAKSISRGLYLQSCGALPRPEAQLLSSSFDETRSVSSSPLSLGYLVTPGGSGTDRSSTPPTDDDYFGASLLIPDVSAGRTRHDDITPTTSSKIPRRALQKINQFLQQVTPPSVQDASTRPNTFLLVDDNPINLKILAAYMKRRHASFQTAVNGQEALDIYTANPAACRTVLMDISMPVMDGLSSTRAIRLFEKQRRLEPSTIIMITGLASAQVQEEAEASGADAYLAKPVRLKELDKVLTELNG
ncbi:hypothetical protein EJ02DRAFT_451368 [Clathrospora elynae]|uniref:histidine kinase n=1 Tax=Clathrospora elynae TaxID=706981 RepID=A0A6A5SYA6_9PLEO|nr:hypothetical protein EJ02DRAFT_451368 [Clathrospora elynae]